jgi:hypothetical protein
MTKWHRAQAELSAIDAAIKRKQDEKAAGYSAYCYHISPVAAELRRLEERRKVVEAHIREIGAGKVITFAPRNRTSTRLVGEAVG